MSGDHGSERETLNGTSGNDVMETSHEVQRIMGMQGDDLLKITDAGGAAWGGAGNDTIIGGGLGKVQSHLYGGSGDDVIYFDTSDRSAPYGDHAWGGSGNDKFIFENVAAGTERITGRIDDFDITRDEIWVNGKIIDFKDLPDGVRTVEYLDQPWLLIEERILYALEGARQNEDPELGRDEEVHFIDWPDEWRDGVPESANISYDDFVDFFPADQLTQPENSLNQINGSGVSEQISGTAESDKITGDDGWDIIHGGDGDDLIDGSEGHDTIYGGDGNDSIAGGLDNDLIYGGKGDDHVYGGSGRDTIQGDDGDDTLSGNNGDDLIYGGDGNDKIYGGRGDDALYGGSGDDLIVDHDGRNDIYGGDGDDRIETSGGSNVHLGEGSDVLAIRPTQGEGAGQPTVVHDFTEQDLIDYSALGNPDDPSPMKVRVENLAIDGKANGLLLTVEGENPVTTVLVDGAGFKGADSLTFGGREFELEDLRAEDASKSWDQDANEINTIPRSPGEIPDEDQGEHLPGYGDGDLEPPSEDKSSDRDTGGGGCFVATAAYGDRMHPDVVAMRAFRDLHLCKYRVGRAFIAFYWVVGPRMASVTTPESFHGRMVRAFLARLVVRLRKAGLAG